MRVLIRWQRCQLHLIRPEMKSGKLNELELEFRKQYQVEITNTFEALGNLNEDEDVNRIWGNIKHNIQT